MKLLKPVTFALIGILSLALTFRVLADAGKLVEVTPEKRPEFIEITSSRLKDGSTWFVITLRKDSRYSAVLIPQDAWIQIRDGERNRFTAKLELRQEREKEEWIINLWADGDCVKDGRVRVTYGHPGWTISQSYSIALAAFAK